MYVKAILSHLLLQLYSMVGLVEGPELVPFAQLPQELFEISGIVSYQDEFFAIADSDNAPLLYRIDADGNILKAFELPLANNDWEAMSRLGDTLYIGDFGNNALNRKHQSIIKLWPCDNNQTALELIHFKLLDHLGNPVQCDIEAMAASPDGLLLFTKEWKEYSPVKIYRLNGAEAIQVVKPVMTLQFGKRSPITSFITDAALSPSFKSLALLSSDRLFYCPDFHLGHTTAADFHTLDLETISQKESLCFIDEIELVIADEKKHGIGGRLYRIILPIVVRP